MIKLKTVRLIIITFFILILSTGALTAQSDIIIQDEFPDNTETGLAPLPGGYGEIKLGMDIADVEDKLFENPNFAYRGAPDVTMLPQDDRQVIDCEGLIYVDHGYFQFNDDKLYLITMVLDTEYIDHYSIYSTFIEKYGEPLFLDPSKTVWEDERVRVSLERPLSIKYIDKVVFEDLQKESSAGESMEAILRQDFLDSF